MRRTKKTVVTENFVGKVLLAHALPERQGIQTEIIQAKIIQAKIMCGNRTLPHIVRVISLLSRIQSLRRGCGVSGKIRKLRDTQDQCRSLRF